MRTLPNPYPAKDSWNKITDFAFVGDLVVKRFSEALRIRHGSDLETDAEFVVCEPYQISYRSYEATRRPALRCRSDHPHKETRYAPDERDRRAGRRGV